MKELADKLTGYLKSTLDENCRLKNWDKSDKLPFFLRDKYHFYEGEIIGQICLFMFDQNENEETPATISKHIKGVMKKSDCDVIYVREAVTAYNRKRLIGHKIPFIIPENQMYLPPLGVDLREHFKNLHTTTKTLAPAAQAILVFSLLNRLNDRGNKEGYTPAELCSQLGYSKMTISRACKELVSAQLWEFCKTNQKSGEYYLCSLTNEVLLQRVLSYMQSPVKSRNYVTPNTDFGCKAGISALSDLSMIGEPKNEIVAITSQKFNTLVKNQQISVLPGIDSDAIEVEVWSYDPTLLSKDGVVDPFSLYASLKYESDERIKMALDEMMERLGW